jgi:hypothetical protein
MLGASCEAVSTAIRKACSHYLDSLDHMPRYLNQERRRGRIVSPGACPNTANGPAVLHATSLAARLH